MTNISNDTTMDQSNEVAFNNIKEGHEKYINFYYFHA